VVELVWSEAGDEQVVKTIARNLGDDGYKFSILVMEIAKSLPFQNRKGDRGPDVH
jgi:hypothetical protein